jgi:hypothetical protein
MLRKFLYAGALVALSTTAAYSQPGSTGNTTSDPLGFNLAPRTSHHASPEERQRELEIESKYRDTVNQMPDKKGSSDPWGNVRGAPAKTTSASKNKQP